MKNLFSSFFLLFLVCLSFLSNGQQHSIDQVINQKEALSHFRFLASDELKGRDVLRPEIDIAAEYIANQYWKYGAKEVSGANGYFQPIPFRLSQPPQSALIQLDTNRLEHGDNLLMLDGGSLEGKFELEVAGYGLEEDLENLDLGGKILVARVGALGKTNPSEIMNLGRKKQQWAKEKGAVGLIEMYHLPNTPWNLLTNYLNKPRLTLAENFDQEYSIPYFWVKDLDGKMMQFIDQNQSEKVKISIKGKANQLIKGRNVIAKIEGTDPQLKDEYVMLSAHYDHLGVGRADAKGDSIYNGARDNAVGTVALINAAQYFSQNPPKRSILLCAWTAEEKGLLGSAYFAENPLVPLDQIVYNLNIDNGGYNSTEIITVVGLGRSTADPLIKEAVNQYGLKTIPDPSPEQGLYDRSDNVNFAKKGIPAPTFSLGFTAFDEEIMKYYHQPADEVDSMDLDYVLKYWKSYLLTAQKIANMKEQPFWLPGDKYELAGKTLYGF